ncbi:hypothetical protein FWK35_00028740 [Aphis craccivora]|uniref:Uncharacterized protein n=1 Tax=Aphis craccivora TaxID=307492 RepID=A0A6G0YDV5_APHCR|nr:hypothetical protein FWK35_00028740 [Aphis craccivora]
MDIHRLLKIGIISFILTSSLNTLIDNNNSKGSEECIDFKMMCLFFMCLCLGSFWWQNEYPWCIIEVINHCKYLKFSPNVYISVIYIQLNFQNIMAFFEVQFFQTFELNNTYRITIVADNLITKAP